MVSGLVGISEPYTIHYPSFPTPCHCWQVDYNFSIAEQLKWQRFNKLGWDKGDTGFQQEICCQNLCALCVRKWKVLLSILLRSRSFPDCPNMHRAGLALMNERLKLFLHEESSWKPAELWQKKSMKTKKLQTKDKLAQRVYSPIFKTELLKQSFLLYTLSIINSFSTNSVLYWLGSHFHAACFLALSGSFSSRFHSFSFWRLWFLAIWSPSLCLVWCYHIAGPLFFPRLG